MSNSLPALKPVLVSDPRFKINQEKYYTVLKSASKMNYRTWTTNSVSTANIAFICPPPSGGDTGVDRKILFSLPIRYRITANVQPGFSVLNQNYDAPRAFPIHSSLYSIQSEINGLSFTQKFAEIIHALLKYNTGGSTLTREMSLTPSTPDLSQNYSDLGETILNPLASSGNYNYQSSESRGSYSYTIVDNPSVPLVGVATDLTAIVDMYVTEEIMLPPYYFGPGDGAAFYNLNTMNFNFQFLPQAANRMWSHSNNKHDGTLMSTFLSNTVEFSNFTGGAFSYPNAQPTLQIAYFNIENTGLTPNTPLSYPWYDIVSYPTTIAPITSGNTLSVTTNNFQLSAIPRKFYIFVRPQDSDYYSSPVRTDTFYSIENLSINYCNSQNLLSNATKQQLYEISKKNGCNMSWADWSGDSRYLNVETKNKYGGIGSVFCGEFGTDIELPDGSAPGVGVSSYNFYVKANIKNCNTTTALDTITPAIYIVVVYDGVFNIPSLGAANCSINVLSPADVKNALPMQGINYDDSKDSSGGNIFTGAKKLGESLIPYVKKANDFLKEHKAISRAADFIHDYSPSSTVGSVAKVARDVADSLGYGVTGGKEMSRKQMLRRLNNF